MITRSAFSAAVSALADLSDPTAVSAPAAVSAQSPSLLRVTFFLITKAGGVLITWYFGSRVHSVRRLCRPSQRSCAGATGPYNPL